MTIMKKLIIPLHHPENLAMEVEEPAIMFFDALCFGFIEHSVRTFNDTAPNSPNHFSTSLNLIFLIFLFVLLLDNLTHFNFHGTQIAKRWP